MGTGRAKGPLSGLRVIEMAAMGPVPFGGMMLADFGAEVIRIDRMGNSGLGVPMENRFDLTSRGHRSITLDLRNPEGIDLALKLVDTADVLLEGMRPGAMERLGLGPETCLAKNPHLIYGRMTGWGRSGPMADRAGHDINYISMNGVLHSIGLSGGSPVPPINLVGDYGGGAMFLVAGILAALYEVRKSGIGQVIDCSMLEGASYLMTPVHMFRNAGMWKPERGANLLDGGAPFYRVYETADGRYMAVGAIEDKFYRLFVDGLGLDVSKLPNPMNSEYWPELTAIFSDAFMSGTRDEWTEIFLPLDACVTPVLSVDEAIEYQHNQERESFVEIDGIVQPNVAPRFSTTPVSVDCAAISAGEDSRAILEELGVSDRKIANLFEEGVVASAQDSKST